MDGNTARAGGAAWNQWQHASQADNAWHVLALPRHNLDIHFHDCVYVWSSGMTTVERSSARPGFNRAALTTYVVGFVLSLVLTLTAYYATTRQIDPTRQPASEAVFVGLLAVLAVTQLAVQLVFFLHVGSEGRPRWNLLAFQFMALVVLILVTGSLWIMKHLNYHGMSPQETKTYIIQDEGFHEH